MDAYLGGANVHSSARFLGSGNAEQEVTINNYYLRGFVERSLADALGRARAARSCWP